VPGRTRSRLRQTGAMSETLHWVPALDRPDLLAESVGKAIANEPALAVALVTEIDPVFADTDALCERFDVTKDESANCVVVAGRRGDRISYAACLVLATTRADVNGLVRKHLDARKASFAALGDVEAETGMEFGGITPVGLPAGWQLLISPGVADHPSVLIGSGLRKSKLRLPGAALAAIPGAQVLPGLAV
jgi:prolyl-tRNA editing enzyme YbaK/EbsC (Cys-tRNA(Pro) deacylase)